VRWLLVVQRNPLYCAISLIGVFMSLASLYVLLAAPFIGRSAGDRYAGAIMVLVVFVIMLLNVEEEERRSLRLRSLVPAALLFAAVLIAEAVFSISLSAVHHLHHRMRRLPRWELPRQLEPVFLRSICSH